MSEPIKEKPVEKKSGFFQSLKKGLSKTRNSLAGGIDNLVHGKATLSPELVSEIEEALLIADVGVKTTQFIVDELNLQSEDVVSRLVRLETLAKQRSVRDEGRLQIPQARSGETTGKRGA